MKVICTQGCQNVFNVDIFKTQPLDQNKKLYQIEATYFQCPHCSHKYISFYTDPEIRVLQAQMRKLLAESDPRKLTKEQEKNRMAKIEQLRKKIKAKMDKLRHKVEEAKGRDKLRIPGTDYIFAELE